MNQNVIMLVFLCRFNTYATSPFNIIAEISNSIHIVIEIWKSGVPDNQLDIFGNGGLD